MHSLNEQQKRSVIVQYQQDHPDQSAYQVAEYFAKVNIPKRTVYKVLQHYGERGDTARAPGSGRKAERMPEQRRRALIKDVLGVRQLSQRDLARKYEISVSYVNKILQEEEVHAYKRETVPYVSEKQAETQRLRIGRLYRHILTIGDGQPSIVMDDESYFSLSNSAIPQNQYYYAHSRGDAPDAQRYTTQQKFQPKILVWLAISDQGISKPFFSQSKQAINQEVYSKHCVEKRLAPFIAEYHSDGQYLFWPDLATSHYACGTLAKLEELGIQVVAKEMNPPNIPQLRPIEDFWGWLKQLVCTGKIGELIIWTN